jgi:hypothetical protein
MQFIIRYQSPGIAIPGSHRDCIVPYRDGAGYLAGGHEPFAAGAALGAEASATLGFAGLLVELTNTNFFFDTATFHQLAKSANRLLSGFSFPKSQLYQGLLLTICRCL